MLGYWSKHLWRISRSKRRRFKRLFETGVCVDHDPSVNYDAWYNRRLCSTILILYNHNTPFLPELLIQQAELSPSTIAFEGTPVSWPINYGRSLPAVSNLLYVRANILHWLMVRYFDVHLSFVTSSISNAKFNAAYDLFDRKLSYASSIFVIVFPTPCQSAMEVKLLYLFSSE
jgi:hypothetical protein